MVDNKELIEAAKLRKARRATQSVFLVCGIGIASWAPMVPYAKDRLQLDDAGLGLLLLLLGAGALLMMPISGVMVHRFGSRIVIAASVVVVALTLPLLLVLPTIVPMAITLFLFGAGIGAVDVAMNAHGVQVQNLYGRPIMSSLHGLFSVGGLLGSLGLGFLISLGLHPVHAAVSISVLLVVIAVAKYKHLFSLDVETAATSRFSSVAGKLGRSARFLWLHGSVLFLGAMCFAVFLSEGAMLDWSAVFLRDIKGVSPEFAGAGYAAFSVAMAAMRLLGDGIVARLSSKKVVVYGGLVAAAGLFLAIASPWVWGSLAGFILLGVGAANIVPVFFSEGGRIPGVPPQVSIPAITTIGYAGQLAGPALLGFIAYYSSLPIALGFTGLLMLLVSVAFAIRRQPAI
ncbi:MFS transporter [Parapedobacter soli]|uniref:MFS transporter n=1 Tax=Parapedobacter soli TaxID=416955 RepID=UPI0021CACCBE|nr:MFS transporter [Parapedobacter soli]